MTADASSSEFVTRDVLRSELDTIRVEIRSELDAVRSEIELVRTQLDAKLDVFRAELRQEMHQLESRMTRWMAASLIGGMVAAATIAAAASAVAGLR